MSYNSDLTTLINIYNKQIKPHENNYTKIRTYLQEVISILNKELSSTSHDLNLKTSLFQNFYFLKAFLTLILPYKDFITDDDGLLITKSSNCKFSISDVNVYDDSTDVSFHQERLFNKVIEYSKQSLNKGIDLLIVDILSAIIFEYIFRNDSYSQYKDLISQYKGSVLSYSTIKSKDNEKWNFNELTHTNSVSPFNITNIKQINKNADGSAINFTKQVTIRNTAETYSPPNSSPSIEVFQTPPSNTDDLLNEMKYENKVVIVFYDAISKPLTITECFRNYVSHRNDAYINQIFLCSLDIYNFLIKIGIEYGFMHNDLHMSNIVLNSDTNKLVIIDFGRSTFGKFKDISYHDNIEINQQLQTSFQKLNYEKLFEMSPEQMTTEFFYDTANGYIKTHVSTKFKRGKYFGIIFDLITFGVNLYLKMLYFNKQKLSEKLFNQFKNNFDKIVFFRPDGDNFDNILKCNLIYNIHHLNNNLDVLIDNYKDVKDNYIKSLNNSQHNNGIENIQIIYNMLLDCLFYFALFLLFIKINYSSINPSILIFQYFQIIYNYDTLYEDILDSFKEYVDDNFEKLEDLNDSFLTNFKQQSGGRREILELPLELPLSSKLSSIDSSFKSKLPLEKSSLKITTDGYKNIFKDINENNMSPYNKVISIKGGKKIDRKLKKYK